MDDQIIDAEFEELPRPANPPSQPTPQAIPSTYPKAPGTAMVPSPAPPLTNQTPQAIQSAPSPQPAPTVTVTGATANVPAPLPQPPILPTIQQLKAEQGEKAPQMPPGPAPKAATPAAGQPAPKSPTGRQTPPKTTSGASGGSGGDLTDVFKLASLGQGIKDLITEMRKLSDKLGVAGRGGEGERKPGPQADGSFVPGGMGSMALGAAKGVPKPTGKVPRSSDQGGIAEWTGLVARFAK